MRVKRLNVRMFSSMVSVVLMVSSISARLADSSKSPSVEDLVMICSLLKSMDGRILDGWLAAESSRFPICPKNVPDQSMISMHSVGNHNTVLYLMKSSLEIVKKMTVAMG